MYNTINGKALTEKFIKTKITAGWTLEDFCSHYDTTEEEFKKRLEQAYYRTYVESILKKMEKNEKKKGKKFQKEIEHTVSDSESQLFDLQEPNEEISGTDEQEAMTDEEQLEKIDSELQGIYKSISDKQERIEGFRNKAEQLSLRQQERKDKVNAIYLQLQEIKKEDENDKDEFANTKSRVEKLELQIDELNEEIIRLKEERRRLQAVVIKVYSKSEDIGDNLEVQNYSEDINELLNGWEQKATEIFLNFTNTWYDVLDRAQIRILAKIHQIVFNLEKKSLKYKLEIEDEAVKSAFENA